MLQKVLAFSFGVSTRPPAFCLKTRRKELKVTETRLKSVFRGEAVKLRHLSLTQASSLKTFVKDCQNRKKVVLNVPCFENPKRWFNTSGCP